MKKSCGRGRYYYFYVVLCQQFTAGKIPIFFAFSAWSGYINFHFTACSTFCYIAFSFKLIKHIEAMDTQTHIQKKLNYILVYVKCGGQPVFHLRNSLNTLPSNHARCRILCARCSRMHCIYYFYFPALSAWLVSHETKAKIYM